MIKVGDTIGVGVFIDSCRKCASCNAGLEQYCVEGMTGTYNTYERDGKTIAFGGYSNKFVIEDCKEDLQKYSQKFHLGFFLILSMNPQE